MTTVTSKSTKGPNRLKMNYTVEKLEKALNSIKEGKLKICQASKMYQIPRQTLADKVRGRRPAGFCRPGPSAVLGAEIESKIENWLLNNAKHGFLMHKEGLNYSIKHILNSIPEKLRTSVPFKNDTPGRGWFKSYRQRHPQIAAIYAEGTKQKKLQPTDEDICRWFNEIRTLMTEKHDPSFLQNPNKIFAANEIAVGIKSKNQIFIAEKKRSCNDGYYSIFLTVNALGKFAPPVLTIPTAEKFTTKNTNAEHDWGIIKSEMCTMTCESFLSYIRDIFYPYLLTYDISFPVVVFLDGDFPYISLPLTTFCEENNIFLIGIPKNSSNILQPLNTVINEFPLEMVEDSESNCEDEHPVQSFVQKLLSSNSVEQYVSDKFKKFGLFPFNSYEIDSNISKIEQFASNEENSLENLHVIEYIESKISDDLLEEFKQCKSTSQSWTGSTEYEALYDFWLNALDAVRNEMLKKNYKLNSLAEFTDEDLEHFIIVEEVDLSS